MKAGSVAYVLVAICVLGAVAIPAGNPMFLDRGAVAIPAGNPMFLDRAIAVEVAFIVLTILTFAGYRKQLYACVPLASIVMVGNSLAPPHVEIMTTFSKPFNAIVLITGGYVLQGLLMIFAVREIARNRKAGKLGPKYAGL